MRLTHPHIIPVAEPVGISFDGRPFSALPGETVAAALSAAGILAFRHTASGAPRGLWCGMGACHDCLVTVDGRANQRACLVKVVPGMVLHSAPPATPAPLAPEPLQRAEEIAPDILVVGAGPAGLSAAIATAEAGCDVLLLDERDAAGGQYLKPLATSHAHAAPDRQFRQAAALRRRASEAGIRILHAATAWGAFAPDEVAALVDGRNVVIRPRRLILAPGAHERPVPIPGWTLPGVMTTGALQTLARANRVSPGRRVVIAGNGPLNLQLACELLAGGVEVAAVLEAASPGPGAWRDALRLARAAPDLAWDGLRYLAALRRAGVPVIRGAMPVRAEGERSFAALHADTPRGPLRIEADVCALNLGFQPETGLARALGCAHRFTDEGLGRLETVTDEDGRTSIAEVFAIGDGARLGGARVAFARGRLAGLAAARDLRPGVPDDPAARAALTRAEAFQHALWRLFAAPAFDMRAIADTTVVCRCEEVTAAALRAAQGAGACSVASLKKATRAGMGSCGGRMCAATVARLAGGAHESDWAAPRAPIRPVPAIALAIEKPEWSEAPSCRLPPSPLAGEGGVRGAHSADSAPSAQSEADEFRPDAPTPTHPSSPSPPDGGRGRGEGGARSACSVGSAHSDTGGRRSAPPTPTLPRKRGRENHDLLIIGAGVIGLAIARAAARDGLAVIALDRAEPGQAASTANAGSLHVQLHAYDSAGAGAGHDSAAAQILALGPRSVALWRDIARDAGESLAIRTEGGLMLAETAEQMRALGDKVSMERAFGVESHLLAPSDLYARHPVLAPGFAGAAFCAEEGQMDPLRGLSALLRLTREAGADIRPRTAVTQLARDGAGFTATTSTGETFRAGRLVLAAGPWSAGLAAGLGALIPVRATVQQVMATEAAPRDLLRPLILHASRHLSLKQGESGHLILGGAWPGELDALGRPRNLRASIEGNLHVAHRVLPALAGLHLLRAWTALNVLIPGPILGEDPRVPGLFHAVTYNGWTLAPVVAELIAEALRGGKGAPPVFSPAAYAAPA